MRSKTLSSILGRADGHDALIELLELGDDVADLRKRIGQIWNMAADNALLDPILEPLAHALSRSERLAAAFGALEGARSVNAV